MYMVYILFTLTLLCEKVSSEIIRKFGIEENGKNESNALYQHVILKN